MFRYFFYFVKQMFTFGWNIIKLAFFITRLSPIKEKNVPFLTEAGPYMKMKTFQEFTEKSYIGLWIAIDNGNDWEVVCGISQFYLDFNCLVDSQLTPGMHSFHITTHLLFSVGFIVEVFNTL